VHLERAGKISKSYPITSDIDQLEREERGSNYRKDAIFDQARFLQNQANKTERLFTLMDSDQRGEFRYMLHSYKLTYRYQCSLGVAEEIANIAHGYLSRQRLQAKL